MPGGESQRQMSCIRESSEVITHKHKAVEGRRLVKQRAAHAMGRRRGTQPKVCLLQCPAYWRFLNVPA
jgi:hypothetical protein